MSVAGIRLYKGEIRITAWRTLTKAEIAAAETKIHAALQSALKELPPEILTLTVVAHKTPIPNPSTSG